MLKDFWADPRGWLTSPQFRRAALWTLGILAVVEGYFAVFVRENDFQYHRNLGIAFLQGNPYPGTGDWYPLARVMMNVPLAVMPNRVSRVVCYVLAWAALWACYHCWRRMAERRWPASEPLSFAAAVLAVVMLVPLVIRDLDECGLQIFLLFFLTAGGYALWQGRAISAGFWLATAASYKATPLLCLPLLLWKRQWRPAAWMCAFTALWAVAPAAFLGWQGMVDNHGRWLHRVQTLSAARQAYPSLLEYEAPKPQNLSLQAALARYVETYPPGHPLHLEHPAFVQFGSLDSETAYRVVRGMMLALAAVLAWRFRRRWGDADAQSDLAPEWATVAILCGILSPLCWKQHLVVVLPAVFLVVRAALIARPAPRLRWALLGLIAAVVLLGRHAIGGREFSIVLLSYKLDTFAVLILMGLVLSIAPRGPAAEAESRADERAMLRTAA